MMVEFRCEWDFPVYCSKSLYKGAPRNRLMLELMARGGMRVGEVLKLSSNNVNEKTH